MDNDDLQGKQTNLIKPNKYDWAILYIIKAQSYDSDTYYKLIEISTHLLSKSKTICNKHALYTRQFNSIIPADIIRCHG